MCAIKFLLPNLVVGVILGERGRAIKTLSETTRASIKISAANVFYPGSSDRIMLVSGRQSQVLCAIKYIISIITLSRKVDGPAARHSSCQWNPATVNAAALIDYSYIVVRATVPIAAGGLLMGRNGATIRSISETSGTRLHISSQEESLVWSERTLTIAGPSVGCLYCIELVLQKLSELSPRLLNNFASDAAVNSIHNYTYRGCFGSSGRGSGGVYAERVSDGTFDYSTEGEEGSQETGDKQSDTHTQETPDSDASVCTAQEDEVALSTESEYERGRGEGGGRAESTGSGTAISGSTSTTHETKVTSSSTGSCIPAVVGGDISTRSAQILAGNSSSPKRIKSPGLPYYRNFKLLQLQTLNRDGRDSRGSPLSPAYAASPVVPFSVPYPPMLLPVRRRSLCPCPFPSVKKIYIYISSLTHTTYSPSSSLPRPFPAPPDRSSRPAPRIGGRNVRNRRLLKHPSRVRFHRYERA